MQNDLTTANIKKEIPGSNPLIDVEKDLLNKEDYGLNSWFIIGHFTDKGHTMSFLFHFMIMKLPIIGNKYLSVVSITDHTTGYYYGEDKMYSASEAKLGKDGFSIEMPNGYMKETWDKMEFGFSLLDWKLSGVGTCYGYPIYSKRTGAFNLLDMYVHQYSIPHMKSKGVLKMGRPVMSLRMIAGLTVNGRTRT